MPSKLWSPYAHHWKLTVPVNKASGSAKLPLILEVRDASIDNAGKLLTPKTIAQLGRSDEANSNIRMEVIDSDKTHKAETTALKKLSAPHTMTEVDRPSVASLLLFEDFVKAALRDNKPLKELMPDLELLRLGKHDNKDLQRFISACPWISTIQYLSFAPNPQEDGRCDPGTALAEHQPVLRQPRQGAHRSVPMVREGYGRHGG